MEGSELVCKLNNADILFFDHIPKASGSTFTSIVDEHFDFESICPQQLWDNLLPELPKNFSKFRFIRGHFGYGLHRILPKKPVFVTMLRNPFDLCISWYEFICRNAEFDPEIKKRFFDKRYKLSDVLNHPAKKRSFENTQTRLLSKDLPPSFFNMQINEQHNSVSSMFLSSVDSSDLEIAKQHLSEFPFFGLTERFEDSMFLLCYTFCWRPIRHIVKKMTGKNRRTSKDFPSQVIDTVKKLTELDTNLYNFAEELFENRYNKMINELKEKYYESRFSDMPFQEMMFEMLERHYEENSNFSTKYNGIDYNFSQGISGKGWHLRENSDKNILIRWTGPEKVSEIDFPLLENQDYRIQLSISKFANLEILKSLKIKINNKSIDLHIVKGGLTYEGIIPKSFLNHEKKFTRLTLEVNNTIRHKLIDKNAGDELVGLALNRIKISPTIIKYLKEGTKIT